MTTEPEVDVNPENTAAPAAEPQAELTPDPFVVLEKLQAENAALRDKALYAAAEADNIKKRTEREKAEAIKYSLTGFARDLLSVADTFDRALSASPQSEDAAVKNFVLGVGMTAEELQKIFAKNGTARVGTVGEAFDHNKHQAISQIPATEGQQPGTVASVLQDGYTLHDRLLRPAMVTIVAQPSLDTAA